MLWGSNIVLTDDNQNVLARYEYEVFGAIRNQTGTSDNTRKFTGKEFDADSNLYYYAARYYDPYIGRFTQRDPVGDGVNWYVYTYNNPLKYVDPTGELAILFDSYFNGPKAHIGWDEDIQRFYIKGEEDTSWISGARIRSILFDFVPGIGDVKGILEGLAGIDLMTGAELSPAERFFSALLLSEIKGVKKGSLELIDALRDLGYKVKVRITRGKQKGVEIIRPDGTKIDITSKRVKEWELEPNNPNEGTKRKEFDNPQPGSKGYKRDPTQAELDLLDKL